MTYTPSFTCGFPLEVFSVSYFRQIDGCLHGYVNSVSYLIQVSGCLQECVFCLLVEAVICQLHEAGWRLPTGCVFSVRDLK